MKVGVLAAVLIRNFQNQNFLGSSCESSERKMESSANGTWIYDTYNQLEIL